MTWKTDLVEQYPSLFRGTNHIGVGDGWRHLIETVCEVIDYKRQQSEKQLEMARATGAHDYAERKEKITNTIWPAVVQIKEKFGTLRFYCMYTTSEENAYLEFAEVFSGSICYECGAPGKPTEIYGYIRTLCNEHKQVDNP